MVPLLCGLVTPLPPQRTTWGSPCRRSRQARTDNAKRHRALGFDTLHTSRCSPVEPWGAVELPSGGLSLRMGQSWSRPFTEQGYTVWWVTRRQNMLTGHSYADMADDYARLIADEFDGEVDLVLGVSAGGEINFHLAASHPETFGHIVILAAVRRRGWWYADE